MNIHNSRVEFANVVVAEKRLYGCMFVKITLSFNSNSEQVLRVAAGAQRVNRPIIGKTNI